MTLSDMSVGMDMTAGTCQGALTCATGCLTKADIMSCAQACGANLTGSAATQFGALAQCVFGTCGLDGGAQAFGACVQMALGASGACASQAAACK